MLEEVGAASKTFLGACELTRLFVAELASIVAYTPVESGCKEG